MKPELDFVFWRAGMGKASARLSTPEGVAHMRARIERFELFRPEEYLGLNPDLAGLDPLTHYSEYGVWEAHRPFVGPKTVAACLGALSQAPLPAPEARQADRIARALAALRGRPIAVHVSSQGRWFSHDLGRELARGLQALGLAAEVADETADQAAGPRRIFVAPHEFFTLGRGAEWASLETLSSSFMYATEPAEAAHFRIGVPYLLACRGVISPHAHVCALLEKAGVATLPHLPTREEQHASAPPDHPIARALSRDARTYDPAQDVWAERPIDLSFMGTESAVRDEFFGANAGFLAGLSCVIHLTRQYGSPQAQQPSDERAGLRSYLGRRTKLLLNLPEEELTSIDWNRMVLGGFAQKALVVSTPCLPDPLFKPGVHYLEESARRLPKLIDWLLRTEDGRMTAERVRHQAYARLMEQASPLAMSSALAVFLSEQAV